MSARPAFASTTARAYTRFVGDINPWTKTSMPTQAATAHLGSTPFLGQGTKAATKKNGPTQGAKYAPRVDLTKLKIESGIPLPRHAPTAAGKYAEFFSGMKPKQAVKCKTDEVLAVASAMRKWIADSKLGDKYTVIQQSTITADPERGIKADPEHGRVWLWPKAEAVGEMLPPGSRGGVAVGKSRARTQ